MTKHFPRATLTLTLVHLLEMTGAIQILKPAVLLTPTLHVSSIPVFILILHNKLDFTLYGKENFEISANLKREAQGFIIEHDINKEKQVKALGIFTINKPTPEQNGILFGSVKHVQKDILSAFNINLEIPPLPKCTLKQN